MVKAAAMFGLIVCGQIYARAFELRIHPANFFFADSSDGQIVQGALDFFPTFFGDMRINFGGLCAGLSEQFLDVAQVHAFLQEMCGERVTQPACSRQRADARHRERLR
jgi:hypothetical protein